MAASAEQTTATDVTAVVSGLELVMDRFVSGLEARIRSLGSIPQEIDALHASFAAGGTSAGALFLQIVVVVVVTACVFLLCRRRFQRSGEGVWRRIFSTLAAAVIAIVAGLLVERLLPSQGLVVRTLRSWVILTALGLVTLVAVRALLIRARSPGATARVGRLHALARDLSIAIAWAITGLALIATLRLWQAGPGLLDLAASLLVALPSFGLFIWTVWRHRKTLAAAVAGSKPRSRWQDRLARKWPGIVIGFLLITFITTEIALTIGVPLPGGTVLLTVVIVFLTPHLDALIASSANRALESNRIPIVGVAARQTARFAVLVIMLTMLGAVWASPLASGFGINLHSIAANSLQVALIAIASAFLWSIVGTVAGRAAKTERAAITDPAVPRSRLGTLIPLLTGTAKAAIVALAFLSVLVSVGVNVWPLITGLSVFGLAIGFGSQTLVKDVVSGLFFLVDDAFRLGEYIETSGAKGTVEKISVRSVTLRNSRGPVSTVPYGQISKVQNFSRDWAIEKLVFRLAFDTDVEVVRKLFKKIGQDILTDPELVPDIIETFKSQGIADVEDGTLVVRGKFVTKPGKQSMVRRAVLKAVHQGFRDNGIRVVSKPLTGDPVAAAP